MGISLFDKKTDMNTFDINFWHWRAIVEAIKSLRILSEDKVDSLHEPFMGNGLTEDEAHIVAAAIREQLILTLHDDERLLLDGQRTTEPDDGTFYRDPSEQHKNYSTNRQVIEEFAAYCEKCGGFDVL